jgi:hypothetical protein
VVVLPLVTMIGVIAYVEVCLNPTERVGKEHTAPFATMWCEISSLYASPIMILLEVKLPESPK